MRALITGAGGLLGSELATRLPNALAVEHSSLDITDATAVSRMLREHTVDFVFHCAAMTNVDRCESEPELAHRINVDGAHNVALASANLDVGLIAISTDYVFDGVPGDVLLEDSPTHPLSVYGHSKLDGERAVMAAHPRAAIVRTSWVYGLARPSFTDLVIRRARAGEATQVGSDQNSSPTNAAELADGLIRLAPHDPKGIFHLNGEGTANRVDWARAALRAARLDESLVESVPHVPAPATRPHFSTMTNTRARSLGIIMPPWEQSLIAFVRQLVQIG